ncbi:C40 family peptidase [Pseudomonas triclosanedens]|uniref:C40 family peptidase n=1 Tax=Pseudomonas triclosanedens TaxID=2961893 RepID=UPI0038B4A8E6
MRPIRLLPVLLLLALKAPLIKADELDVPVWRSYSAEYATSDVQASPVASARPRDFSPTRQRIVQRARELIGQPYRWGGESLATGFDCSGLLVYLFRSEANLTLPRTTASMIQQRELEVARSDLQPGDAVFFNRNGSGNTRHVGLYIGNGRFIHAPRTGQTIRIDSLSNLYWQRSYTTARRFRG